MNIKDNKISLHPSINPRLLLAIIHFILASFGWITCVLGGLFPRYGAYYHLYSAINSTKG